MFHHTDRTIHQYQNYHMSRRLRVKICGLVLQLVDVIIQMADKMRQDLFIH